MLIAHASNPATGASLDAALLGGIVYFATSPTLIVLLTSWSDSGGRHPDGSAAA